MRSIFVFGVFAMFCQASFATAFFQSSEIIAKETNPFKSNHGSTLTELPTGEMMSCWFAGLREAGPDVQIICSNYENGKWKKFQIAVSDTELDSYGKDMKFVGNPVLFYHVPSKILWLFYEGVRGIFGVGGHSAAEIHFKISRDFGKSWEKGRHLVGSPFDLGHLPRNKPIMLPSGEVLLPVYREFIDTYSYIFWLTLGNDGKILKKRTTIIPGMDHLQPSLIFTSEFGRPELLAYMRDKNEDKAKRAVQFSSYDFNSNTWSYPISTNLDNPNSAVDTVLTDDGYVLIAYNDAKEGRRILSLAISTVKASLRPAQFRKLYDFEATPEVDSAYSYPCLFKDSKGQFHITYSYHRQTIKHVTFNNEWLLSKIAR